MPFILKNVSLKASCKTMISFLKLIRWPNLLIILISMLFTLLLLIRPILGIHGFEQGMGVWPFSLLLAATILIAAGGYLINDFYDMNADSVNKPGKNLVGRKYPVYIVDILYWFFTLGGVLAGLALCWWIGHLNYSLIFVFSAGLLWFYASRYQCQPLVGNVVVAFLSALSFGLVWVFEFIALSNQPESLGQLQASFGLVNRMMGIYVSFAFLVSLLREIVKDIEDIKGDDRFGCRTFAVVYGAKKSTMLALVITGIGLFASLCFQYFFFQTEYYLLFSSFFLVDLLFLWIGFRLRKATDKTDYANLSKTIKLLMVTGILSMALIYFEM